MIVAPTTPFIKATQAVAVMDREAPDPTGTILECW